MYPQAVMLLLNGVSPHDNLHPEGRRETERRTEKYAVKITDSSNITPCHIHTCTGNKTKVEKPKETNNQRNIIRWQI